MEHDVLVTDGNLETVKKALAEGKTVLAAVEIAQRPEGFVGENIKSTLDTGFAPFLGANITMKEELKGNEGYKCFCGKPATHLVFFYN